MAEHSFKVKKKNIIYNTGSEESRIKKADRFVSKKNINYLFVSNSLSILTGLDKKL